MHPYFKALKGLARAIKEQRYLNKEEHKLLSEFKAFEWKGFNKVPVAPKGLLEELRELGLIYGTYDLYLYTMPKETFPRAFKVLEKVLPFWGGKLLDGSLHFAETFRQTRFFVDYVGVEPCVLNAYIAKYLCPYARVMIQKIEYLDEDFDWALSILEPHAAIYMHQTPKKMIAEPYHAYRMRRMLECLKYDGLACFLVDSSFLDHESSRDARLYLGEHYSLVGAVRIAESSIPTDILIVKKSKPKENWEDYYQKNPEHILGKMSLIKVKYGERYTLRNYEEDKLLPTLEKILKEI